MSDERLTVDDESEAFLAELWSTPVGRRWVLKAGLGSAAALAAEMWAGPGLAQAAKRRKGAVADAGLQFALGPAAGVSDLVMVANGHAIALEPHTDASRARLESQGGLWAQMDLAVLTHQAAAGAFLPDHRALLVSVYGRRNGRDVVVGHLWHVPAATTLALAQTVRRLTGSLESVTPVSERLKALGVKGSEIMSPQEVVQLDRIMDTSSSAASLVMMHPNVATINPTAAGATKQLLGKSTEVGGLAKKIAQMQTQGKDFAVHEQATNRDGSPAEITINGETTTFTTIKLSDDPDFRSAIKAAVSSGIRGVRDNGSLGAVIDKPLDEDKSASTKTWVQPQGAVPRPTRYDPSALRAGVEVKVKDEGLLYGTYTTVNGGLSGSKLPLKLYNNYVRWVWVYVQYIGKNGENLSLNPNATWPDTQCAQSLGLLPQVFTVLGVPIWDTNTIEVELNFPEGAHSARILYCGLGSNLLDGGWRQYFPADAYPDRIAPTDEVLVPALLTGIFTIGLNVFALATDLDIATTWKAINNLIQGDLSVTASALKAVISGTAALTATETFAALAAAGGATYVDVKSNNKDTSNIWGILLGLASSIPKIIFNPAGARLFFQVAGELAALETATKLVQAIPIIGQVIAVTEAVGDAVTLAEVCAETIVCPWVIENEISLQYDATVTIKHDPRDGAGFPASAGSWRLEAKIDGASALAPVTGSTSDPGYNPSRDLIVSVVAPFGGEHIQWSFVMLDGPLDDKGNPTGNQVGTGVSAQHSNDNPNDVFSEVEIEITELPATITASTVFQRHRTTTYRTGAPRGYTWSNEVSPVATVLTSPIQSIISTTVATRAGVAGVVWLQDDRYHIRGIPLSQPAETIDLGGALREGFARRPYLLFDAFALSAESGNHVLLEPDEKTDAYHIRKVTLNPTTGAISWDPAVSGGTFLVPPSAAALHSGGRVVAVSTASGRLAWLAPVETPRPPLAAYSAGPGSQIGLLDTPVSLAVTNPGVVLVLEAGSSQISAFDTSGNPVAYFAPPSAATRLGIARSPTKARRLGASGQAFSMPLVSAGTYLDIAVDGANQIYVLYYTGNGSNRDDYHVDVYSQDGTPLNTNSPGVNIAHLAVDYWRSIYGANYSALNDFGTTTPHISTDLKVIEPSLSQFVANNHAALGRPRPPGRRHRRHRRRHHRITPTHTG